MFPLIQVENSDILQYNKHFTGAYYLPGFDIDTDATFNSSHSLTAHFQWLQGSLITSCPFCFYYRSRLITSHKISWLILQFSADIVLPCLVSLPEVVFWSIFFFGSLSSKQTWLNSEFKALHNVANFPNVISENDVYLIMLFIVPYH